MVNFDLTNADDIRAVAYAVIQICTLGAAILAYLKSQQTAATAKVTQAKIDAGSAENAAAVAGAAQSVRMAAEAAAVTQATVANIASNVNGHMTDLKAQVAEARAETSAATDRTIALITQNGH
jgi:hypothetical protein